MNDQDTPPEAVAPGIFVEDFPLFNPPARLTSIGAWLVDIDSRDQLVTHLLDLLQRDELRVRSIQYALSRELATEDPEQLSKQVRWLDAQMYFVATLKSDADALLDKAEKFFLPACGTSALCVDDEGRVVAAGTGGGWAKACDQVRDIEKFSPKYVQLTDNDRKVECASECAGFRRLRDEYVNLAEAIRGRLFRARDILEEITARHKAAGIVERHG
jgi:hypothetical protein